MHIHFVAGRVFVAPLILLLVFSPGIALASGTPVPAGTFQRQLIMQQGPAALTSYGDYISATVGGLVPASPPYRYYVEVPPTATRLVIDMFDADVGTGGAGDNSGERDRDLTANGFGTTFSYTLTNPAGGAITENFTSGTAAAPVGADNAWLNFYDSAPAAPAFAGIVSEVEQVNTGTIAIPTPAGAAVGNLLLAIVQKIDDDGNIVDAGGGATTDWIELAEDACSGGAAATDQCRVGVFYRLVVAGELGSHTFTLGATDDSLGAMLLYTGVDTGTPLAGVAVGLAGNSNAPTAPSMNVTSPNARVVRLYGAADNTFTTQPAGLTARFDNQTGTEDDRSMAGADTVQSLTGASGTAAFGLSSTEAWYAVTVALRAPGTATPLPGHWLIEVDGTAGEDVNALGIRAHDGDPTAAGHELNMYAESFYIFGINNQNTAIREYDIHPYVTSGCTANTNNFDFDQNEADPNGAGAPDPPYGSISMTSRTGAFVDPSATMSNNDTWLRDTFGNSPPTLPAGWTTRSLSDDYGIWRLDGSIENFDAAGSAQGGNYGPIYVGRYNVDGTAPPSAQPEANTFRMYLPRDGAVPPAVAPPLKPYLAQQLTHVSGPNPPQVGQVTRYAVTVRMTNPTGSIGSILFGVAGTDRVTVTVPASNANATITYRDIQAIDGTATDPATGSTTGGTISWDPGLITAGTTDIVAYWLDVQPITAAEIPLTGVPGNPGTGTRAVYIDETCVSEGSNVCAAAQLTRSRYTFGEICQLSTSTVAATAVTITELKARPESGGVAVEWETGAEAGTVGFDLYRWDVSAQEYLKLNEDLLPAALYAPQGAQYRFLDETASANEPQAYYVVERESSGVDQVYGPYEVEIDWSRDDEREAMTARFDVRPRDARDGVPERSVQSVRKKVARYQSAASHLRVASEAGVRGGGKLLVEETGLYRVSLAQLATALKTSQTSARLAVAAGRIALTNGGQPVAWTPMSGFRGIQFVGQRLDTPFSPYNVYQIDSRAGVGFGPATAGGPVASAGSFVETMVVEQDVNPVVQVVPLDPLGDNWFWDNVSGNSSKPFALPVPSPVDDGSSPSLEVALQGGAMGSHNANVYLNGVLLGSVFFSDLDAVSESFDVPAGLLAANGNNTVQVTGVASALLFVDRFEVTYRRAYVAQEDEILVRGDDNSVVSVSGLTQNDAVVLDVADPRNPKILANVTRDLDPNDGSHRVSFVPSGADVPYLVSAAYRSPAVMPEYRSSLRSSRNGARHLVITADHMLGAAQELANYRQGQGLSSQVIDVADIYDEFNYGVPSPLAIRDFLSFAAQNWRTKPRYVLLAGDGSYDYRNLKGFGDSVVPPLLVVNTAQVQTLSVSDSALGDINGDGVPEMAIGRVPALDSTELLAYLAKVQAYESGFSGTAAARTLLAVDATGPAGGDFVADSAALGDLLPAGYAKETVSLTDYPSPAVARLAMIDAVNEGSVLTSFVGHGGVTQIGSSGLLRSADVPSLTNVEQPTVLLAATCHVNGFGLIGFEVFGETLLLAEGGAVAVWSPTSLSLNERSALLTDRLFRELFQQGGTVLGDVVLGALEKGLAAGISPDALRTLSLLGDPATVIPHEPGPIPSCSETPEGCAAPGGIG